MEQLQRDRHPYQSLLTEVEQLRAVPRGWDSYRGDPVDEIAVQRAVGLIARFQDLMEPVPRPVIGPTADGAVVLRWELDDRDVDIVFRRVGGRYLIAKPDTDEIFEEGTLDYIDPLKHVVWDHVLGRGRR